MNVINLHSPDTQVCVNHAGRETALRCGKCGDPICTRCMVQTPVGVRCRGCAQLRRLPQFDVGAALLARSMAAGFGVSLVAWFLLSFVPFLRFFLSILVGAAVGEVMSRLARRRVNRLLEVEAVIAIVSGLIVVESIRAGRELSTLLSTGANSPSFVIGLLIPVAIASFVAIVKLR